MKPAAIRAACSFVIFFVCYGCGDAPANKPQQKSADHSSASASDDSGVTDSGLTSTEYYSAQSLLAIESALAKSGNPTKTFGRHKTFWYVAADRTVSGSVEVHDSWIDVTFVQGGNARLITGGTVTGSHLQSPGEHRGGAISGGTTRTIATGDMIVIPAHVPHQYQITNGQSLRYLTIKVAAENP
jgi:hypothetical protein